MQVTRRDLLQKLMAGGAVAATGGVGAVVLSGKAEASETAKAPSEAVGMLYDATKCVGCQSCVAACAEANQLQPDPKSGHLHYTATDLNSFTKNIIKLYRPAGGTEYSFVKQQCMHCIDPACAAGCPFSALKKNAKTGVVEWESGKCIGCRYCEISCAYHVPKFQWEGVNPKIVKCELCKERLAKAQQPACTSVCPVNAVIFGKRTDLLKEAKRRIAANPGCYYQDRVYGENDGGGTQVLYLTHVPFAKLGLPELGNESIPEKTLKWQKLLYSYLAVPVGLFATVATVVRRNFSEHQQEMAHEEQQTGLRPQL